MVRLNDLEGLLQPKRFYDSKSLADAAMQFKSSKSHNSIHMTSPCSQASLPTSPVVSSINLSLFGRSDYIFIIILAAHMMSTAKLWHRVYHQIQIFLRRAPIQHCFGHVFSCRSSSDSHKHVCLCTSVTARTSVYIFRYTHASTMFSSPRS